METRRKRINYSELVNPKFAFSYQRDEMQQKAKKLFKKMNADLALLIETMNLEILEQFTKRRPFSISGRILINKKLFNQLHFKHAIPIRRIKNSNNETFFENVKIKKIYRSKEDIYVLHTIKCCVQTKNGVKYRLRPEVPEQKTKQKYFFRYSVLKTAKKERKTD
jgi:hypothetical protein